MQFVETETWLSTFNYIISFKTYRKGPLVMFLSCLRYPIWIAQYIQHKSDREPIQKPKETYRLAPSCIISYYTLSFITTNIYIYIYVIYIYIYVYVWLWLCILWAPAKIPYISVITMFGYRFFWRSISLSRVLCHYRFWRGPYRFTVFHAHLSQKCFCHTTVVFNHFDRNSYDNYLHLAMN